MSEQNNIFQLPKNSHSEDYLQSSFDRISSTNSPETENSVELDFHRASEQAVSLEQVQAARLVNEIINQNELGAMPYDLMESAPDYMTDEEKLNYLDIKKVSSALQIPRKEMLDGAIVMSREQLARYNKR